MISPVLETQQPPHLKTLNFSRRSLLPLRSDQIWKIESGVVRTFTWSEEGTIIPLGLWGPEDIVGRPLSKAEPYTIECLTPVEVTIWPAERWHEVTHALIRHSQQVEEFLEMRHCKPLETAVLRLLTWLSKKFGRQVAQGQLIDLRLTHQEMSEIIGSNRVTVTRVLNNFEKQGIICRLHRSFILVPEQQPFWHYEI